MKIQDEHLYHGAALTQIAEHPQFTAINSLVIGGKKFSRAFKVNDSISVYLKYATLPTDSHREYIFNFKKQNLNELKNIQDSVGDPYIALSCIEDREICCVTWSALRDLLLRRKIILGHKEDQYTVLVTLKKGQAFRVNINQPGRRNLYLGKPIIVDRSRFPAVLFENG